MSHEIKPLSPTSLEPTKEAISEMSFRAAMQRAIEDLFVCQAIAERAQKIPSNDVLPVLLETWKQGLADRLQTEAQFMVDNVTAILDLLQSGEPISEMEPMEWQQAERWYAPFPVATVCREDLHSILPDEEIAHLNDEDMTQIATQMGDTLRNTDVYRQSLEISVKSLLDERQGGLEIKDIDNHQTETPDIS